MSHIIPTGFIANNPFRVDFPDGTHARFPTLLSAAKSAVHHRISVYCEKERTVYEFGDCIRIVNGVRV